MPRIKSTIHRVISWWLVFFSLITIMLGYSIARHWVPDIDFFRTLHLIFEWSFIALLIFHIIYTLVYVRISSRYLISQIRAQRARSLNTLRIIQQVTKWMILIFAFLVIFSGLNHYSWFAIIFESWFSFMYHVQLDVFLVITIVIHVMVGGKLALNRRNIKKIWANVLIVFIGGSLISVALYLEIPQPTPQAQVVIGSEVYIFNPLDVTTLRPDLFQSGYFSMFDVLAHLDTQGRISMEYHLDSSMNTYVIDSLNGYSNWWYYAHYSGGYIEQNNYRMDHYLWKEESYLELYQTDSTFINTIFDAFREETSRLANNSGVVVIPRVVIQGQTFYQEFYNISVTAHNLRNESLTHNVITAIDVIMSLGDAGLITYSLQWYDSLGSASVVRSYWVESINADATVGRCGFVYECGDEHFGFGGGNLIHIPSDVRILNSPEYVRWFWKCL